MIAASRIQAEPIVGLYCNNSLYLTNGWRASLRPNRKTRADREFGVDSRFEPDEVLPPPLIHINWTPPASDSSENGSAVPKPANTLNQLYPLDAKRFTTLYTAGALWENHFAALGQGPNGEGVIEVFRIKPDPIDSPPPNANGLLAPPTTDFESLGALDFATAYEGALAGSQPIAIGPFHGHPGWAVLLTVPDGHLYAIDLGQLSDPNHVPAPPRVLVDSLAAGNSCELFSTATSTFGDAAYEFEEVMFGCLNVWGRVYYDEEQRGVLSIPSNGLPPFNLKSRWRRADPTANIASHFGVPNLDLVMGPRFRGVPSKSERITNLDLLASSNSSGTQGQSPVAEVRRGALHNELELKWSGTPRLDRMSDRERTQTLTFGRPVVTWSSASSLLSQDTFGLLVQSVDPATGLRELHRFEVHPPESKASDQPVAYATATQMYWIHRARPIAKESVIAVVQDPQFKDRCLALLAESSTLVSLSNERFDSDLTVALTAEQEPALAWRFDAVRSLRHPTYGPSIEFLSRNAQGELESALILNQQHGAPRTAWKRAE